MIARAAVFVALIVLSGCSSMGGSVIQTPTAVTQVSSLQGEGVIGAFYVGPIPLTYPIRFSGSGTLRLQYPAMPYVSAEGDLVIEPVLPSAASGVAQDIASGRTRVTNNGVPVALSAPGTIKKENP